MRLGASRAGLELVPLALGPADGLVHVDRNPNGPRLVGDGP
jgi:hypothetical protein